VKKAIINYFLIKFSFNNINVKSDNNGSKLCHFPDQFASDTGFGMPGQSCANMADSVQTQQGITIMEVWLKKILMK
jgi:hypothetical protein